MSDTPYPCMAGVVARPGICGARMQGVVAWYSEVQGWSTWGVALCGTHLRSWTRRGYRRVEGMPHGQLGYRRL